MSDPSVDDVLAEGIHRLERDASGILDVFLIDSKTAARLFGDGMRGDIEAARLFGAVLEAGKQIAAASHRSPVQCVCCPRRIRRVTRDTVFGVAAPAVGASAIGFAICPRCSANRDELLARASDGLRRIWPDLRPIIVTHPEGGRA